MSQQQDAGDTSPSSQPVGVVAKLKDYWRHKRALTISAAAGGVLVLCILPLCCTCGIFYWTTGGPGSGIPIIGGVEGKYECVKKAEKAPPLGDLGDALELRSDSTMVYSSKREGNIVGAWKRQGSQIELTFDVMGTKMMIKGAREGGKLKLEDGSEWSRK